MTLGSLALSLTHMMLNTSSSRTLSAPKARIVATPAKLVAKAVYSGEVDVDSILCISLAAAMNPLT